MNHSLQRLSGRKRPEAIAQGPSPGDGEHLRMDPPLSELVCLLLIVALGIPSRQQSDPMAETAQCADQVVVSRPDLGLNIWSDVQDVHAG